MAVQRNAACLNIIKTAIKWLNHTTREEKRQKD
jgi:hypothetical protein